MANAKKQEVSTNKQKHANKKNYQIESAQNN
jgi:hypothetical protein